MQIIKNYYFKQGKGLMSGISLPDVVKETHFIDCDFHPNVWDCVKFIDCKFDNCDMPWYEVNCFQNCEVNNG